MMRYQVARSYSKALFKFPATKEELEKRSIDLEEINRRITENPKLFQFLNAPDVPLDRKKDFLKTILDKDFDPLVYKFIFVLLERKRLKFISEITVEFNKRVNNNFNILVVHLISALPLDQDDKDRLKDKVQKSYPDKKISFTEEIDPKLIGGMVAIVDRHIIDFSVKNQLSLLKEKLLAMPVINR